MLQGSRNLRSASRARCDGAHEMRCVGTYSAVIPAGYRVDVLENTGETVDIVLRAVMEDVEVRRHRRRALKQRRRQAHDDGLTPASARRSSRDTLGALRGISHLGHRGKANSSTGNRSAGESIRRTCARSTRFRSTSGIRIQAVRMLERSLYSATGRLALAYRRSEFFCPGAPKD